MATDLKLLKGKNRFNRFIILAIAACTMAIFFSLKALAEPPIYYPNGRVVWRGNVGDTVFHENGQVAWRGNRDNRNTVFYSNGQVAWRGSLGNDVFYNNGQIVWRGDRGDSCYKPNGSLWRRDCESTGWINLGSGISLQVTLNRAQLKLRIPQTDRTRSFYTRIFELANAQN